MAMRNVYGPGPVVPEDTPDLPAVLGLRAAEFEIRSSRPMLLAAQRAGGLHVVIRGPADACKIANYRTFTRAEIVDVNAAVKVFETLRSGLAVLLYMVLFYGEFVVFS